MYCFSFSLFFLDFSAHEKGSKVPYILDYVPKLGTKICMCTSPSRLFLLGLHKEIENRFIFLFEKWGKIVSSGKVLKTRCIYLSFFVEFASRKNEEGEKCGTSTTVSSFTVFSYEYLNNNNNGNTTKDSH